jgi:hypothetical protein
VKGRQQLIDQLSHDLQAVRPAPGVERLALLWLCLSAVYVVAVTHLLGPIRPAALTQLLDSPRFLLETLSGVVAIALVGLAGFRAAVPGRLSRRFARAGVWLMLLWLGAYVAGLYSPALEPSMLGKRPHCVFETLLYGVPPVIGAFLLVRRLYPLQPLRSALSLSLAGAMMPALYMQLACMYSPAHILGLHIAPGLLLAALGTAAVWAGLLNQGGSAWSGVAPCCPGKK